jgi:AraC-like DNA-binding protein
MHTDTYALDAGWRAILKDLKLSPGEVLRRAGLPEDLMGRPAVRLAADTFHRLWESIEATLGDPLFPLRLCTTVRGESFSPALFAALCSPNLLVAIRRIADYKALVAPTHLLVGETRDRVTLEFRWPDVTRQPPASLVVTELLFFVTLARMGTREQVRPLLATTGFPPPAQSAYAEFLGVPVRRGQRHRLVFTRHDALRPFLTADEGLWRSFEPALRSRLAEIEATGGPAARVRAVLLEALPAGTTGMDAIARRLHLGKRTLQRQLEAEGTSYARLLRETREALARHYLRETGLSATEIAFLLGFDEPNSFYRACRGWTGKTPDALRREVRAQRGRSRPAVTSFA